MGRTYNSNKARLQYAFKKNRKVCFVGVRFREYKKIFKNFKIVGVYIGINGYTKAFQVRVNTMREGVGNWTADLTQMLNN